MALDLSNAEYTTAIEYYLNGNRTQAKDALEALLERYPKDHFIPLLLGNIMYSLGRIGEAIQHYEYAIKLKPDFGNAYYRLGVVLYRSGRLEAGLRAFNRVIELKDQSHAMANYFVGLINLLLGNDRKALEGFSNLIKVSPDSHIANFYLAQLMMKQHKYEEALKLLNELLQVTPNLAEVHYLLGVVLFRLHRNTEAIKSYRRALELNPNDSRARSTLELLLH